MKYTRYEFKGVNTGFFRRIILFILILVPITASIMGIIISKTIVIPYMVKADNPLKMGSSIKVDSPTYKELKTRKYYLVQMGAFSDPTNAESLYKGLHAAGIPGYIVHEGQYYMLSSFVDLNMELVYKKSREYKEKKYGCLVKTIDIAPAQLPEGLKKDRNLIVLNNIVYDTGELLDSGMAAVSTDENKAGNFQDFVSQPLNKLAYDIGQLETLEYGVELSEESVKVCAPIKETMEEISNANNIKCLSIEAEEKVIKMVWSYRNLVEWYNEKISGNE